MRIEPRPLPEILPFLGEMPTLLTRLYAARGVQSQAELDKSLARLIPYQQLKGIDAAVDLLVVALEQRQRILIVGDFDADGALDGLFKMIAQQEETIRKNPAAAATSLAKKVFGAL